MATEYEAARESNPVDFLVSGVFAPTLSIQSVPTFLWEIVDGRHEFVEPPLRQELNNKYFAGCAAGILNCPRPVISSVRRPGTGTNLQCRPISNSGNRPTNWALQKMLGLTQDKAAPGVFLAVPAGSQSERVSTAGRNILHGNLPLLERSDADRIRCQRRFSKGRSGTLSLFTSFRIGWQCAISMKGLSIFRMRLRILSSCRPDLNPAGCPR